MDIYQEIWDAAGPAGVRIIAAMINPIGPEEGAESITLLNVLPTDVDLTGWRVVGPNGRAFAMEGIVLGAGEAMTIPIPKNTAQLSNEGGSIRLHRPGGALAHEGSYTKQEGGAEGQTVIFSQG